MARSQKPDEPLAAPATPEPSVDTTQRQRAQPAAHAGEGARAPDTTQPKLPHERDESVDMTHGKPDVQIQQAYSDVKRGLQDTDRGPPAGKAYQRQK